MNTSPTRSPALPDIEAIKRLIRVVDAKLAGPLAFGSGDYEALRAYYRAADAILDELERTHAARISRKGGAWTLSMAGVRASSTGGASSLLRNWRAGAQKRIAGGG